MKTQTKKGMSTGAKIGIGATVAAAGVAAYLLLGPNGKKNRKAVSKWAGKMKEEVAKKLKSVKALTEPLYHNIVNEVYSKYQQMKGIDKKELATLKTELRKHWKTVSRIKKPAVKAKPKSKSKAKAKKK